MKNKISFFPRVICILVLIPLIVLHVFPLPILEVLILYVVLYRPQWFKKLVEQVYREEDINNPEDLE